MKKKNLKGFTLLEITVVISIFIIFMIASYDFILQGFKNNMIGNDQEEAVSNARKASDVVVKELRTAKKSDLGDYLFDSVATNSIRFYSDIDHDNSTEKVRYFLDGAVFKKGVIKPTGTPLQYLESEERVETLASHINNKSLNIFSYYDTYNNLIASSTINLGLIRLVKMSLKINVTPETAPADYFVDSNIEIRNLKDNL